jgi:hypothetical protein
MHLVINERGVTAHGDALARRIQICLAADCVLIVAQIIARVGQQLDERNPYVRNVPLLPIGHDESKAI